MFKKSLLSLLVVSSFAFATEKAEKKNFTEADVANKVAEEKSGWQSAQDRLQQQRANFLAAEYLLDIVSKQKNLSEKTIELTSQLLATLDGYPLQMEAEWALLKAKIETNQATEADLTAFSKKYPNSPYQKRLAQMPFEQLYNQKKFAELVEYGKSVAPESEHNQCRVIDASYKLLAEKIQQNSEVEKVNGVQNPSAFVMKDLLGQFANLWQKSTALPAECMELESYWKDNGGKTGDDIRLKAVNLVEKNAKESLQQLIAKDDNELNRWLAAAAKVVNDPSKLEEFVFTQPLNEQTKMMAKVLFPRWVRTLREEMNNPSFAIVEKWATKLVLSPEEIRDWKIIYLNRLFDNPNIPFQLWRDEQIKELKADNLTERRLRMALWQKTETDSWLGLLSAEGKAKQEWRYWMAKNEKNDAKRKAMFAELSKERGFYPMLAAQQIGEQYQFKRFKIKALDEEQLRKFSPQFNRLQELRTLERFGAARVDLVNWFKSLSADEKLGVTNELLVRGWNDLAVEGTIQAKAFDYINLRLPDAYANWFSISLKGSKISKTFAQAIARQESAWNAQAKSHANAIGLMQMLPSTAQKTATDNKLPFAGANDLLKPFNNIMLGTMHLSELNEKYPNNRFLIASAYNAGASRVDRWLARANGTLALDEFVASIPFYETRGYVQNVVAYDYYYQLLQKVAKPQMFYQEELERKY